MRDLASGRAAYGVGMQLFDCWGGGLESRRRHGYSSVAFIVCCVGSGLCERLNTPAEESYRVSVCV